MGRTYCGDCCSPEEICECPPSPNAVYIEEHGGLTKIIEEHRALTAERDSLREQVRDARDLLGAVMTDLDWRDGHNLDQKTDEIAKWLGRTE